MLTYRCCQLLLLLLLRLFYSLLLRIENVATCCRLWVSWTRHVLASGAGDMVAMLLPWYLAHNKKSTNAAFQYHQSPTGFSTVSKMNNTKNKNKTKIHFSLNSITFINACCVRDCATVQLCNCAAATILMKLYRNKCKSIPIDIPPNPMRQQNSNAITEIQIIYS